MARPPEHGQPPGYRFVAADIHRRTFVSVHDLVTKIRLFINGWNDRAHPFDWTKTADQIQQEANRPRNSTTKH